LGKKAKVFWVSYLVVALVLLFAGGFGLWGNMKASDRIEQSNFEYIENNMAFHGVVVVKAEIHSNVFIPVESKVLFLDKVLELDASKIYYFENFFVVPDETYTEAWFYNPLDFPVVDWNLGLLCVGVFLILVPLVAYAFVISVGVV